MVVCKFFLQGTCKFGSSCKYEHQINDSSNTQSILRQPAGAARAAVPDVTTLVRSVQTDMNNTEKGGQWLLSCYAPFKEKAAFPGFEDKSFEEVRLGFYEATKTGTVEQFKQQLQALLQDAVMKIRVLQNPTDDIVNLLKQLYNTPANPAGFTGNGFAGPVRNGAFGAQNGAPSDGQSVFGGQTKASPFAGPGVFGGTTAKPEQSIFGGSFTAKPVVPSSFNPFVAKQEGTAFGQQPTPFAPKPDVSPFAAATQGNSPLLASSPYTQNPSPFGNQAPQFATQQPFTNPAPPTQSVFAQPSIFTPSPFAPNPAQPQTAFAPHPQIFPPNQPLFAPQTQPPFVPQQPQLFAPQTNAPFPTTVPAINNSPFAVQPPPKYMGPMFPGNVERTVAWPVLKQPTVQLDKSLYSSPEDLTTEELEAFQSDTFVPGKIPEKPPPVRLCF